MNEFATVLNEIILKHKKQFKIKELAQEADITPSYLSNMKLARRKPPTHETLNKLTEAFRHFGIADTDIARLIDAYNRTQFGTAVKNGFSESQLEKIRQRVETHGIVREQNWTPDRYINDEITQESLIKGNRQTLISQAVRLLKTTQMRGVEQGEIYITWFHDRSNKGAERELEEQRELVRSFLWMNSPFKVFYLRTGSMAKGFTKIVDFLAEHLGTSNCFLYEIPNAQHFPEIIAVSNVGFIEAKPDLDGEYWIHTVLAQDERSEKLTEATIGYLEYLLGPEKSRQPLVETETSDWGLLVTPATKKLAEIETQNTQDERILLQASFSTVYRGTETYRRELNLLNLKPNSIDPFIKLHSQRIQALQNRLDLEKERVINKRGFFRQAYIKAFSESDSSGDEKYETKREILKEQLLTALNIINIYPNFQFAFPDDVFCLHFEICGNTAMLSFEPAPGWKPPFDEDRTFIAAWTNHPEVISLLRYEFDTKWKEVEPRWRTDTEEGRRNILDFFVADSLKVLLDTDVPSQELWSFMYALADNASYLDCEAFRTELYRYEQSAKEILIVSEGFPMITIPITIEAWDRRSTLRTRQRVLYSIIHEIDKLCLITTQTGIENYWKTHDYGRKPFKEEWIEAHFQYVKQLLSKSSDTITMAILPSPEQLPVNFEIVDREFVLFEKDRKTTDKEGGIALHDKELAEKLGAYVERHLSAKCPEPLKGSQNVVKWLDERFRV
jgi:transcriptional regulator with XRE-family HTH domain